VPSAAAAATPFTAGSGSDPSVAVGADGTGHVVWETDEPNTKVGYCRVSPGATACNRIELLNFDTSTDANAAGHAVVFTPAPNKVVIVAGCWNCPTGILDRTYRWISVNNGASFSMGIQIGNGLATEGYGTWLDDLDIFVGASDSHVKAAAPGGEGVQYATGGIFSYGPQVVRVPGTNKLVAATNDLEVVKYGVYNGASPPTATTINNPANWLVDGTLPGAEGDNSDTALNSGPNGVLLSYLYFVANDSRIGLRRFDSATNTFGPPVYVEGSDPIDDNSLQEPDSFQDPAGRIHLAWSSLFDGGRLRYRVSDPAGNNFTAAANLAKSETFNEPEVAAGIDGRGFVTWTPSVTGPIRVVPIDPQAEPTPAPPPDTKKPTVGGFGIDDKTLAPGQKTSFRFTVDEAGTAVLTIEKRFNGLKGKKKGKRVCLPKTKKRIAALRKQADSPAELRKLLKKRSCKGWKRIGEIRQRVVAGRNTIEFGGRVAGRKLQPGAYRALLVVTDTAGLVSRTEKLSFQVVAKKAKKKKKG
jgi:hypothetical protein